MWVELTNTRGWETEIQTTVQHMLTILSIAVDAGVVTFSAVCLRIGRATSYVSERRRGGHTV